MVMQPCDEQGSRCKHRTYLSQLERDGGSTLTRYMSTQSVSWYCCIPNLKYGREIRPFYAPYNSVHFRPRPMVEKHRLNSNFSISLTPLSDHRFSQRLASEKLELLLTRGSAAAGEKWSHAQVQEEGSTLGENRAALQGTFHLQEGKKAVGAARRDRAEGRTWDVPTLLFCVFTLLVAALFNSFGSNFDRYKATYPKL